MLKTDDHEEYNTNTAGFFAASPYQGVEFNTTEELIKKGKRGVFKVGSALIASVERGKMWLHWMNSIAREIANLTNDGKMPIIVSSGAVAAARVHRQIKGKPITLEDKQALAALGNIKLGDAWLGEFAKFGLDCGMLLISYPDLQDKNSRYNLKLAVENMLRHGMVPILNENDSISTYELRFGDNDTLSANIASLFNSDYLVLLSDIPCLYDRDPNKPGPTPAKPIRVVDKLTPDIMAMGGKPTSTEGTGGMYTKLHAAKIAMDAGCHMIITKGEHNPISTLIKNDDAKTDKNTRREQDGKAVEEMLHQPNGINCTHTLFIPEYTPLQTHIYRLKQDLLKSPEPQTKVLNVTNGSLGKLRNMKFLYPDDLESIEGNFMRGDAVVVKEDNENIAVCRTVHGSKELSRILQIEGKRTEEKVAEVLGYGGRFSIVNPSFAYPYGDVMKANGPSTPGSDSEDDSKKDK